MIAGVSTISRQPSRARLGEEVLAGNFSNTSSDVPMLARSVGMLRMRAMQAVPCLIDSKSGASVDA